MQNAAKYATTSNLADAVLPVTARVTVLYLREGEEAAGPAADEPEFVSIMKDRHTRAANQAA